MSKKRVLGKAPSARRKSVERLLEELQARKCVFDAAAQDQKSLLLKELERSSFRESEQLARFHDLLCFMQAYPESRALLTQVNDILGNFHDRVDRFREGVSTERFSELSGTGMVGTQIYYPFSFHTAKWLARHYPSDIVINWDDFEELDVLCEWLPAMTSPFEAPSLEDMELDTDVWVKYASEREGKNDFEWLMERMTHTGMPELGLEAFYELLNLPIIWSLNPGTASRTRARVLLNKVAYQRAPLLKQELNVKRLMGEALPPLERVSAAKGRRLIAEAINMLSVRNREIYPLFVANPRDVIVIKLERGVTLVLIGMKPTRRFSLETDYFFFGLKNNVPVTYGSSAICLDQAEVAINIFSSFRQGESALLYTQVMRAFHQIFGVRAFLVEKFQIGGDDNDDALQSGAFWFYHKLGFRPIDPEVAAFGEQESQKRKARSGYRTSRRGLKRLAESNMRLFVSGSSTLADKVSLPGLGLLVSDYLGVNSTSLKTPRSKKMEAAVKEVRRLLEIRDLSRWTSGEKFWLREFSPLVVHIPHLERWSAEERRDLAALIKAKGQVSEVDYVLRWNRHGPFIKALCALSKKGTRIRDRLIA